jgi:aspartate/methionine/tyrosine aminotransferase
VATPLSLKDFKVHFKGPDLDYGSGPWGSLRLRKAMANYMDKYFKPLNSINPDDILFAAGCTSLFEMLGFTIFEPGDGLLLSRPIYQAFKRDFSIRAQ